jgi:3-hexulose-6-phosphate synthase
MGGVIKAANANNAEAQIDLISVKDKKAVATEAAKNGAQIIGVHTGLDAQAAGQTPFADLQAIASLNLGVRISVAGGLNKDTIQKTIQAGATIVVVGAAIYGAPSPADSAKELRALVDAA